MTNRPIFGQTPKSESAVLTAANTARDGSGSISTVVTLSANGAVVKKVRSAIAQATAAASSAMVSCWWYSTDGGTTWRKLIELALGAVTTSNTAVGSFIEEEINHVFTASTKIGVSQTIYAGAQDRSENKVEYIDY